MIAFQPWLSRASTRPTVGMIFLSFLLVGGPRALGQLDEHWTVAVNGQSVVVDPDGGFRVDNIAAADLFGLDGPGSRPDFLSDDFLRVTGIGTVNGITHYAFSDFFQIRQGETFLVDNLTITDTPPLAVRSLRLQTAPGQPSVLTTLGGSSQLQTIATLSDGSENVDVTPRTKWTVYRTSNPGVATVDQNGLVTATGRGTVLIIATNEGATATTRLIVSPGAELTTIEGFVRFENGAPAAGATVTVIGLPGFATSGADGRFEIPGVATNLSQSLKVVAQLTLDEKKLFGSSTDLLPISGGITDAGVIIFHTPCDPQWARSLFPVPGITGQVNALVAFDDGNGPALYVGGSFTTAEDITANNIAKWKDGTWSSLGTGLNGSVQAMTVFDDGTGPALYVGGGFTTAGGTTSNNIAKWRSGVWSALGSGLNGIVQAVNLFDDGTGPALYVGGSFTTAGGANASRIAKWRDGAWSSVGTGLNGVANVLTVFDDGTGQALYAGGQFNVAGGNPANNIAKWNGTAWAPLGNGLTSTAFSSPIIYAMTVFDDGTGSALYAGGFFTSAGSTSANNIAKWKGNAWLPVGSGTDGYIKALTVFNDGSTAALYASGEFTTAGTSQAPSLARWNGITWAAVGGGLSSRFYALTVFDDRTGPALYAGGVFSFVGNISARSIAKWDGAEWSPLTSGLNGWVTALTVFNDGAGSALYAGGLFSHAGLAKSKGIAKWNGTAWSPVGGGLNGSVIASIVFDDGTGPALCVGGNFTTAGGAAANSIAKWNGTAWSPLGNGLIGDIKALAVFNDGNGPALYAGGYFHTAGGFYFYLAKWRANVWSLINSPDFTVNALIVFDDGNGPALYAGGNFTRAGGITANHIAKWNGTAWSSVGTGLNGSVYSMTVFDDGTGPGLYAGGDFSYAGLTRASHIAKWNGAIWLPVGDGLGSNASYADHIVSAMTVFNDGTGPALYAGGELTTAGGNIANYIAKWDGTAWLPLGSGLSGVVWALTVFDDGGGPALYAGGSFSTAGGQVSANLAKWYVPQSCVTAP